MKEEETDKEGEQDPGAYANTDRKNHQANQYSLNNTGRQYASLEASNHLAFKRPVVIMMQDVEGRQDASSGYRGYHIHFIQHADAMQGAKGS
jgi:hypothetical protein